MIDGPRPLEPKGRAQALLTLRAACLSSPDPTLTPASMSWSTSSCTVPNIHSLVPPGCPVGPVLGTSAKSLQLCPTLCDPIDCGLPGSSVHGTFQARILEWLPCPPPKDLPDPEIEPMPLMSPHWQAGSLPLASPEKPVLGTRTTCKITSIPALKK